LINFSISYIVCTKNRLSYLKILFDQFLNYCQPDEEIIVIDGNSTDGSKEFLQQLFDQGKIHQLVSEPDKNQAHGWNKGFLLARGTIIKKMIDDDVHSLSAIRRCKQFMLQNPLVDICISNCLVTDLAAPRNIHIASRLNYYEAWKAGEVTCFTFSDVYMLIRKNSLSYLGLFDTQFTMMDWEYSLRCSFLKANIAYYTGYNSLAVDTPGNVTSSANKQTLKTEGKIGAVKYGYKGDRSDISLYSEIKIAIGKAINYRSVHKQDNIDPDNLHLKSLDVIYNYLYQTLEDYNQANDFTLISK
jgi:glycosyltransferase involved in cell wall biosynthesis